MTTPTPRPTFGQRTAPPAPPPPVRHRPSGWHLTPLPGVVTLFGTPDPEAVRAFAPSVPAA